MNLVFDLLVQALSTAQHGLRRISVEGVLALKLINIHSKGIGTWKIMF